MKNKNSNWSPSIIQNILSSGGKLMIKEFRVVSIDLNRMKATINKVEVYSGKKSKTTTVHHKFHFEVDIPKDMIEYREEKRVSFDGFMQVLEKHEYTVKVKHLSNDNQVLLVEQNKHLQYRKTAS